ncbi:MAG: PmoA family protein [Planctomycetaceae bacterium]|nr:PmoA family protein [Planctomycetales bacterium]MCB9921921.1 PmoA family protein [Planctomycetaceae bacterium]
MRSNLASIINLAIVASIAIPVATNSVAEEAFVRIERTNQGLQFRSGDRPVLFYQSEPITEHGHTRAGFVHPLYGLDGELLTESFPKDHRHHQGVFWAWHQLWVGDRKVGDPWVTKDHLVVVKETEIVEAASDSATLDIQAEWTSNALDDSGTSKAIIGERTRIQVFREKGDVQYVDFTIQLTPLVPDVKIGGSEDAKGYSGFTVRVKPPTDMIIRDERGVLDDDAVQSTSTWSGVSGSFGDQGLSGIAILSHPSLTQFPPRWVLRHYGMQNVAYPGREPIALSAEQPLVIRHRLVIHRGTTDQARIMDHQRTYELTP